MYGRELFSTCGVVVVRGAGVEEASSLLAPAIWVQAMLARPAGAEVVVRRTSAQYQGDSSGRKGEERGGEEEGEFGGQTRQDEGKNGGGRGRDGRGRVRAGGRGARGSDGHAGLSWQEPSEGRESMPQKWPKGTRDEQKQVEERKRAIQPSPEEEHGQE